VHVHEVLGSGRDRMILAVGFNPRKIEQCISCRVSDN
jgi:hypothetical protein